MCMIPGILNMLASEWDTMSLMYRWMYSKPAVAFIFTEMLARIQPFYICVVMCVMTQKLPIKTLMSSVVHGNPVTLIYCRTAWRHFPHFLFGTEQRSVSKRQLGVELGTGMRRAAPRVGLPEGVKVRTVGWMRFSHEVNLSGRHPS